MSVLVGVVTVSENPASPYDGGHPDDDLPLLAHDEVPDNAVVMQCGKVMTDDGIVGRLDYDTVETDEVDG
jgi:hypothetical protein